MEKPAPEYESPEIIVLGTVADMTLATLPGGNLDLSGFLPSNPG